MEKPPVRYLGEVFVAFVIVVFVTGIGSVLGLTLYATRLRIPLLLFEGPTYLFFILVGSGLGYVVNRRQCSRAAHGYGFCPRFGLYMQPPVTLAAAYTTGRVCWATSGTL